jgi:hypothetical protein
MSVVEAGTNGGPHDDPSVYRSIDDFGIPVFHGPGRFFWPQASSLNGVRGRSIPSGVQAREQILIDRIEFVVVKEIQRGEKSRGSRFTPVGTRGLEVTRVPALRSRAIQIREERIPV